METLLPAYEARGAQKMGLKEYNRDLAIGLLTLMYEDKTDFTNTYRALASVRAGDADEAVPSARKRYDNWHRKRLCLPALLPASRRVRVSLCDVASLLVWAT
jgi:hypothetical protein